MNRGYGITSQELRAVVRHWEQYGRCDLISHLVACSVTKRLIRRGLDIMGETDNINRLLLAMGFAACLLEDIENAESNVSGGKP